MENAGGMWCSGQWRRCFSPTTRVAGDADDEGQGDAGEMMGVEATHMKTMWVDNESGTRLGQHEWRRRRWGRSVVPDVDDKGGGLWVIGIAPVFFHASTGLHRTSSTRGNIPEWCQSPAV